jgi:hypothetical protein
VVVRAPALRPILAALGPLLLLVLPQACKPNLDLSDSLVDTPRVLAARSVPAEGPPGTALSYAALYVDGSGPITPAPLQWDFCEARNPLANLGPVNDECLEASGSWFTALGDGAQPMASLPSDGCKLFGSDVPPPVVGQPQGRPVDPDSTGGYYQPVRVLASDGTVDLVQTRIVCGLAGATADVGVEYGQRYRINVNPDVQSLSIVGGAPLVTGDKGTNPVAMGQHLMLRAAWPSCPATMDVCGDGVCGPDESTMSCASDCAMPLGCDGAERFLLFDVVAQALVVQRESIAVAWYTTGGTFDLDRTGRVATDLTTTSDNGWTAPSTPGTVHVWIVLRDNRGGSGWAEYVFDVH